MFTLRVIDVKVDRSLIREDGGIRYGLFGTAAKGDERPKMYFVTVDPKAHLPALEGKLFQSSLIVSEGALRGSYLVLGLDESGEPTGQAQILKITLANG